MRTVIITAAFFLAALPSFGQRQMENLSRGLTAIPLADEGAKAGAFVSWRLLGTDPAGIAFNLYRQTNDGGAVRVNAVPLDGPTCYEDLEANPSESLSYHLRPVVDGEELASTRKVKAWGGDYHKIPIQPIDDYRPGDASVADLDGDGELDIVLHQTSHPRDNGSAGVTGEPILDAYRLDGTLLWRINLGKNIRDGEHYTQFMVYDLDGDGRAEVACKTADGTIDGTGHVIGDATKDWRTRQPGSQRDGRILDGPEYFTIFDGTTGAELKTVDYVPSRYPINGWGGIGGNAGNDSYGNRCDRFLACIAYLDGKRPSVVMCRGVYGRIVMAAWDWRDGALTQRWVFDSGVSHPPHDGVSPYSGMGGHSLSVGDVDGDGRDEVAYQAMVIDDDGKGLYSTGLRHGDSMHLADMYPDRPGMEIFTVQENEQHAELFQTPGAAMRDARTGEILWSHSPTVDVPAGMAADIDPTHPGYEAWGGPGGLRNAKGETMGAAPRETSWCLWWDGDPLRELLSFSRWRRRPGRNRPVPAGFDDEPTRVVKWNWEAKKSERLFGCDALRAGRGPAIVGDLVGDWREELLLVDPGGESLRLYSTTIPTDRRLVTLLHDPQYRLGMAWQNVVYNKPCHPSYFLGDGMSDPAPPSIYVVGDGESLSATTP